MVTSPKTAPTCDDILKGNLSHSGMARNRRNVPKPPRATITPTAVTVGGRLALALAAREAAEVEVREAVRQGRSVGLTWEQIGSVAGITRQAARERWSRL